MKSECLCPMDRGVANSIILSPGCSKGNGSPQKQDPRCMPMTGGLNTLGSVLPDGGVRRSKASGRWLTPG